MGGRRAGCSERPPPGVRVRLLDPVDDSPVLDPHVVEHARPIMFGQFRQLFGPLLIGALAVVAVLMVGLDVLIGVLV